MQLTSSTHKQPKNKTLFDCFLILYRKLNPIEKMRSTSISFEFLVTNRGFKIFNGNIITKIIIKANYRARRHGKTCYYRAALLSNILTVQKAKTVVKRRFSWQIEYRGRTGDNSYSERIVSFW